MPSNLDINRCFMRFEDRAERIAPSQIAETFVSVGPLLDVLSSRNNQIMYGRRGTGKTHALRYFGGARDRAGDISIYVDCQNIGSNQSIYDDISLPISERATRLLVDVCTSIHRNLLDAFTDPARGWELSDAAPLLDGFSDAFSETRIVGPIEVDRAAKIADSSSSTSGFRASIESRPSAALSLENKSGASSELTTGEKQSGSVERWIEFGFLSKKIRELARFVGDRRIWLLLDEWSTIPAEIQPYLADLIRRSMFGVPNISVKIAAIEHRSTFKIDKEDEGYIGFELGADITPAINLDDYLVFDVDEERSKQFFSTLIANHVHTIAKEIKVSVDDITKLISLAFTQENVFTEFVKASEGVPRDAMHILGIAAQKANQAAIAMPVLRAAALSFFQADKYTAIQANPENRKMLDWIRDEVIGARKTRAFILPVGTVDQIIDRLFDRRALHILSRSMSAAHRPGERFIVYKLDYGCYVDLINTGKYPTELLLGGNNINHIDFDVPDDDARSYRRAILDLTAFYGTEA